MELVERILLGTHPWQDPDKRKCVALSNTKPTEENTRTGFVSRLYGEPILLFLSISGKWLPGQGCRSRATHT